MLIRTVCCLLPLLGFTGIGLSAQQIAGRINLDTTRWAPVAYLSLIPDFSKLFSVSNESIIGKSGIDREGRFHFDCRNLPPGDHLYRLHLSKKGDPAASLIIDGLEENHLFLLANRESDYPNNAGFYEKYLRKWKKEDSEYFRAFRAQLPVKESSHFLMSALKFLVFALAGTGVFIYLRLRIKTGKNPYQSLTVQERKIFSLLKNGHSNKEISEECGISLSTVKSHINNIYSKLDISSRTDVMDYGRDG